MDPDLVRQQEEAEREALALQRKKQLTAASASVSPLTQPDMHAPISPSDQNEPTANGFAYAFTRFISYGFAGAIIGLAAGNAAVSLLVLPQQSARAAVLGATAFFALLCGVYSQTKPR